MLDINLRCVRWNNLRKLNREKEKHLASRVCVCVCVFYVSVRFRTFKFLINTHP